MKAASKTGAGRRGGMRVGAAPPMPIWGSRQAGKLRKKATKAAFDYDKLALLPHAPPSPAPWIKWKGDESNSHTTRTTLAPGARAVALDKLGGYETVDGDELVDALRLSTYGNKFFNTCIEPTLHPEPKLSELEEETLHRGF
eukprot:gene25899-11574_t